MAGLPAVILGLAGALAIYLALFFVIARELTHSPLSWRILAWSGVPLALSGAQFAARFWHPSPGPYVANVLYPFGAHLNAWAVAFGFTWMALGLLFSAMVVYAWPEPGWRSWLVLLGTWVLCWWPHGIIAVGFALNGANRQSMRIYRDWGGRAYGLGVLIVSSILLLWHFTFSVIGFIATARAIARAESGHALRA